MSKILVPISLVVSICLSLQYIESSTGLIPPNLEGGRTELEFADINNDGHLDILSIGDHGSPYINTTQHGVMVWFGNGQGPWTDAVQLTIPVGTGQALTCHGDIDHNGYADIAVVINEGSWPSYQNRLRFLKKHHNQ